MKKRILCLFLGVLMLLSVFAVTGCSGEEEEAPEVEQDIGAKTITLRLITEKKVCNTQAELDEYLTEVCGGDKESQQYKDMLATMDAYADVEAEITKITKSNYKTNVDILFYTEDEYYEKLEKAMEEYVIEQQNAAFAARALDKYMKEYKAYDPTASDASIRKSFYKYFPEYVKYKGYTANTDGESVREDQYVKNEQTGIKELVYPDAEPNQIDIIYLSGYDMYMDYIEKEWIQGLNAYIATTGKKLTYNISPTLLDGVKVGNETYAIPNNVQIGEYTYMLIDKELAEKYEYPYTIFENLVDEDCRYFIRDIYTNEADVLPINYTFDESMSLFTWYWNIEFDSTQKLDVPDYKINTENKFSVIGTYISDPANFGRGKTELSFTSLFANEQYRETFLCLKEYQFNDCFGDISAENERTKAAITFENGNYSMYRTAFFNKDGTRKNETDDNYGVYTDASGREYYLYIAKYPVAEEKSLYGNMFAVCSNTKYTQACMEVITLINTDPEIRNLLQYGIKQGEHRDGQTPNYSYNEQTGELRILNDLYVMDIEKTGNCFIAYPGEGRPANYWEDAKAQNNDALINPLLGFEFNDALDSTSGRKLDERYLIDLGTKIDKKGNLQQIDTDLEKIILAVEAEINLFDDYASLESYVNDNLAKNLVGENAKIGNLNAVNMNKITDKFYNPNTSGADGKPDTNGESPYAIYYNWLSKLS